jgi:Spy/CpxP family protein refolding chaperone
MFGRRRSRGFAAPAVQTFSSHRYLSSPHFCGVVTMSHRRAVFVSAVFGLAVLVGTAAAQQQGQPGGRRPGSFGGAGNFGGPGAGGPLSLLANEQVQKELELLPDQVADFTKLRDEMGSKMRERFAGMRELSEEDRRKKFDEMRPEMEKMQKEMQDKMKEVLLPHQNDRLRELFVQARGAGALEDEGIANELKLSDDQKKQIADVRQKQREKMGALFQNRGQENGDQRRSQFESLREESNKLTLDVLSSEQRDQFEKMKGEKADFELNAFGGFGGRGGPGGPGGGFRGGRPGGGDRPGGNRPGNGDRPNGNNNET